MIDPIIPLIILKCYTTDCIKMLLNFYSMFWGLVQTLLNRDGAHGILQIRSSIQSDSWQADWQKFEILFIK